MARGRLMDRTLEFSAAVRRFRKAYGASKPASELMRPIQSSQFNTAASTILASIIRMHGFLLSQMDEFFSNPEEVPEDAVNFIRLAQVQMETLRASIAEKPFSVAVHRKAVIVFLQERLKVVEDIVGAQAKVRARQARLSHARLAQQKRSVVTHSEAVPSSEPVLMFDELSPLELRELQQENEELMKQLQSEVEEAEQIEKQMQEVASLVSVFSEKLVEQQDEIENLLVEVGESRALVTKGNQHIASATQSAFSFRLFILCFMVGASLLLLFLDWYSP